jgi:hypothetical protein
MKLLNKLTVSHAAELSKAYTSQVKHGTRPPSERLRGALEQYSVSNIKNGDNIDRAIDLLIKSRQNGISPNNIVFYRKYLSKSDPVLGFHPTPKQINAYYRAISVFYNWLYSPRSGFNFQVG